MNINVQPQNSVFSKSPILYMVTDTDLTRITAIADVYLWKGDVNNIPATKSYRLKKSISNVAGANPSSAVFNIARLVDDTLSQPDPTSYNLGVFAPSTTETTWMLVRFGWITNTGTIVENQVDSDEILCIGGYGEFLEGTNQEMPNILTSVKNHNISSDNKLIVGIANTADKVGVALNYKSDLGNIQTFTIAANTDLSGDNVLHFDMSPSLFAGTYEKEYKFELITNTAMVLDTINIKVDDLCKYEPLSVGYVNRYGVWDFLPFNGKSILKTKTKTSDYQNSDLGLYLDTEGSPFKLAYDDSRPQYKKFNGEFRRMRDLTTNFVTDEFYSGLEQLMISDRCYLWEYTSPVNPMGNSLTKKTGLNDKLIQYSITFEEAYNVQNQIL